MYGHDLVAIYPSHLEAEAVKEKLLSAEVTSNSVRLSDAPNTVIRSAPTTQREEPGFFAWLFGDVSEDDRTCYDTHMQQNRAILSVHVDKDQEGYRRALVIMEEARPIRLDDDTDASSSTEAISSRPVATQHQGNPAFANPPPVAGRSAQSGTQQRGQGAGYSCRQGGIGSRQTSHRATHEGPGLYRVASGRTAGDIT